MVELFMLELFCKDETLLNLENSALLFSHLAQLSLAMINSNHYSTVGIQKQKGLIHVGKPKRDPFIPIFEWMLTTAGENVLIIFIR